MTKELATTSSLSSSSSSSLQRRIQSLERAEDFVIDTEHNSVNGRALKQIVAEVKESNNELAIVEGLEMTDEDRKSLEIRGLQDQNCLNNAVKNGHFEDIYNSAPWNGWFCWAHWIRPGLDGSDSAFILKNRARNLGGISQFLVPNCFREKGKTWQFVFQFTMHDAVTKEPVTTCVAPYTDLDHCPRVLITTVRAGKVDQTSLWYNQEKEWKTNGDFMTIDELFYTDDDNSGDDLDTIYIWIHGGSTAHEIIVDNVDFRQLEITEMPTIFTTDAPTMTAEPTTSPTTYCGSKNFVKNPDAETGTKSKWMSVFGNKLEAVPTGYGGSGYSFKATNRPMWFSGMMQMFEHTCLEVGSKWRFRMKVKLYDQETGAGITTCNPRITAGYLCPFIYFRTTKPKDDGTGDADHYKHIQDLEMDYNPDGWNTFDVVWEISEKIGGPSVKASAIFILGGPPNSVLEVDDVSIEYLEQWETPTATPTGTLAPTPAPTDHCHKNFAGNSIGDFEGGSMHGYFGFGGEMDVVSPGADGSKFAGRLYNRPPLWGFGAFLWVIDHHCVEEHSTWHFSFKARLYDSETGRPITSCSPHTTQGTDHVMDCPYIRLTTRHSNFNGFEDIHDPNMIYDYTGGWTQYSVDYTLPDRLYGPHFEKFWPIITGGPANSTLEFDDLEIRKLNMEESPTVAPSITPMPSGSPTVFCSKNFIRNPDGEFGAPSYWMAWGNNYIGMEEPGFGGVGYALKAFDRTSWNEGITQVISHSCLLPGSTWRFQAKIKLYDQTSMQGISCNPKSTTSFDCPFIRMAVRKYHENVFVSIQDHKMTWDPNGWNTFDVVHTMEEAHSGGHVDWFMPIFVGGPPNSVLLIDDVIIEALEEWETPTASPTSSPAPSASPSSNCNIDLVKNPHFDSGNTDYWNGWGNPIETTSPGWDGTGHALRAYDREQWHRGVGYWMDPSCLAMNSTWHIKFKVRLENQSTGAGITECLPMNELSNYCPMLRLITSKGDDNINFDYYRDTDMVWNPDGWSDFDIKIKLNPENSGPDVDRFFPYFVGGPAGSVLLLDDVSIIQIPEPDEMDMGMDMDFDMDFGEVQGAHQAQPLSKTCMSIGDPHIQVFNGTTFDIHETDVWYVLYERQGVKVEAVQGLSEPHFAWTSNYGWRVTQNGAVVAEGGADGYVPPDDGILFIFDPFTLYVRVHTWKPFGTHWYDIFITTSWHEDATGLCADDNAVASPLTFPMGNDVIITQATVEELCANAGLLDWASSFQFDNCVADAMLVNSMDFEGASISGMIDLSDFKGDGVIQKSNLLSGIIDFVGASSMAYMEISDIVLNIQQTVEMSSLIMPMPGLQVDESFLAATVPLVVMEDQLKKQQMGGTIDDMFLDLNHEFDGAQMGQAVKLEPEVKREGDAMKEVESGVNGDPLIMGLQRQVFNFDGKNDAWYVNLANSALQWNMKFHEFPHCPADDRMYVTSMGLSVNRTLPTTFSSNSAETGFHNILLNIKDLSNAFTGCPVDMDGPCLGDGSLVIDVDGFIIDKPGDYRIAPDLRIVTHNTWNACSRRWYDYDKGQHIRDQDTGLIRKLSRRDKKKNAERTGGRRLDAPPTTRRLDFTPIDFVRYAREHMVEPMMCKDWIQNRASHDDLFEQTGGWTTIYIETPLLSYHVEYRQIEKASAIGGGSGLPQDLHVNGVYFPGTETTCVSHVLDAWLTHAAPEVKREHWDGVLGETRGIKLDEDGDPIRENRNIILSGSDVDYEVTGPFDREFSAKSFNLEMRRILEKQKQMKQQKKKNRAI